MFTILEFSKVSQSKVIKVEATWADVGWNTHCIDQSLSHGYQITYCQVPSDRDNTNCTDAPRMINITGAANHNFTIKGLDPYHTYMVNIAAQSPTLTGPPSDPVFFTTLEAAPSPPRSLKVLSATQNAFTLEWEAPAKINGVLNRYIVYYNNGTANVLKHGSFNDTMTYVLTGLVAHTHYTVSVVACISVLPCSKASNTVNWQTDIGKPGIVELVSNNGNVIKWNRPLIAGGDLDYYEMEVNRSGDLQREVIYLNGTTCTLPMDTCSNSRSAEFRVRAVNLRKSPHSYAQTDYDSQVNPHNDKFNKSQHHHHSSVCVEQDSNLRRRIELLDPHAAFFYGEWINVRSDRCSLQTSDFPLLIGMMFLVLIVAMFLSVQYMWKKLERMRNIEIVFPYDLEKKLADSASGNGRIVEGTLDTSQKGDIADKIQEDVVLLPADPGFDEERYSVGEDATEDSNVVGENSISRESVSDD